MTLTLVQTRPDVSGLARWAVTRGYAARRSDDLGYALHAAFKECLGDLAPQPFLLRQLGQATVLLGYSAAAPQVWSEAVALPLPEPRASVATLLGLAGAQARQMPGTWQAGRQLSFEVRCRPIARSRRDPDGSSRGRGGSHEVDVAALSPDQPKEQVYLDWLARQFEPRGARLVAGSVTGLRRTRVLRRPARQPVVSEGPDVTMAGTLEVADATAFAELLARGVGRHRAFGFGLLLIAPSGVLG